MLYTGRHSLRASLAGLSIVDCNEAASLLPLLLETSPAADANFLTLRYEKNPAGLSLDHLLEVHTQPLTFVLNWKLIERVLDIFKEELEVATPTLPARSSTQPHSNPNLKQIAQPLTKNYPTSAHPSLPPSIDLTSPERDGLSPTAIGRAASRRDHCPSPQHSPPRGRGGQDRTDRPQASHPQRSGRLGFRPYGPRARLACPLEEFPGSGARFLRWLR